MWTVHRRYAIVYFDLYVLGCVGGYVCIGLAVPGCMCVYVVWINLVCVGVCV